MRTKLLKCYTWDGNRHRPFSIKTKSFTIIRDGGRAIPYIDPRYGDGYLTGKPDGFYYPDDIVYRAIVDWKCTKKDWPKVNKILGCQIHIQRKKYIIQQVDIEEALPVLNVTIKAVHYKLI